MNQGINAGFLRKPWFQGGAPGWVHPSGTTVSRPAVDLRQVGKRPQGLKSTTIPSVRACPFSFTSAPR